MINGGYILQPRIIDESDISNSPPHVREIWLYILRKANHKDSKSLKRGQLFTSYKDIISDLAWFVGYRKETYKKHHCEIAMKVLTKKNMITTTKTTRGLIVTICKYDYYQDSKNYENDSEKKPKATRKLQSNDTIDKNDKNDKNDEEGKEKVYSSEIRNFTNSLSKYFSKSIIDRLSDSQKKSWLDTVDKLIRIDNYSEAEITLAVKNATSDSFWSNNFYSLNKLRKKNDKQDCKHIVIFLNLNKQNGQSNGTQQVYTPPKNLIK